MFLVLDSPFVLEHIFSYLDHVSLTKVQRVCKSWYKIVNEGKFWSKQLDYKVSMIDWTLMLHNFVIISCWLIVFFFLFV